MWSRRPRATLALTVPGSARAGDVIGCALVIDAPAAIDGCELEVVIEGTERGIAGASTETRDVMRSVARLGSALVIPEGRSELPFRAPIDRRCPPTYAGEVIAVSYSIRASMRRRASELAHCEAPLIVTASEIHEPPRPQVFSRRFREGEVEIELGLGSTFAPQGAILPAALAISGLPEHVEPRLSAALSATEHVGASAQRRVRRYEVELEPGPAGETVAFRLEVPRDAVPGFELDRPHGGHGLVALAWTLELAVAVPGAVHEIAIPISIGPQRDGSIGEPPPVGAARCRALWSALAPRAALHREGERWVARRGPVQVEVQPAYRRDPSWAVLRHRPCRLGMSLDPEIVREAPRTEAEWRSDLRARDPVQALAHLRAAGLLSLAEWSVDALDDAGVRLRSCSPLGSRAVLERALTELDSLAAAIAIALDHVPPPAAMKASLDRWVALARELGGELETARMCVQGVRERVSIAVSTQLEGARPIATWLRVDAGERDHVPGSRWARESDPESAITRDVPGETGLALVKLCEGATELRWSPVALELRVPPILETAPGSLTAREVVVRLERMAALLPRLWSSASPYR